MANKEPVPVGQNIHSRKAFLYIEKGKYTVIRGVAGCVVKFSNTLSRGDQLRILESLERVKVGEIVYAGPDMIVRLHQAQH